MISRLEGANPVVNSAQEGVESVSILAVIVLYRLPPSESPALLSLRASATALNHGNVRLKILLYDNTPAGQRSATIPEDIEYWPAGTNQGISAAYNFALKMAGDQRFDWLLTLDQDTTVPASFLECISALARNALKSRALCRKLSITELLFLRTFWFAAALGDCPKDLQGSLMEVSPQSTRELFGAPLHCVKSAAFIRSFGWITWITGCFMLFNFPESEFMSLGTSRSNTNCPCLTRATN